MVVTKTIGLPGTRGICVSEASYSGFVVCTGVPLAGQVCGSHHGDQTTRGHHCGQHLPGRHTESQERPTAHLRSPRGRRDRKVNQIGHIAVVTCL